MHIVFTLANNSTAPYFLWFAEKSLNYTAGKYSFVCLYHQTPVMMEQMKKLGIDCYWIYFDHRERKTGFFSSIPKLIRLFKKIKPDVVHAHLFDDALPALIAARFCGIKKRIITKGDTGYHWHNAPGTVWFDKLNNKIATHIVTLSEESRQFILGKEKANAGKIRLIHHGIPVQYAHLITENHKSELKAEYDLHGKKIIGSVSRMIGWKGHRYIIEAAAEIVSKFPDTVFVLVGDGPYKNSVLQLIKKHSLERHFCIIDRIDPEKMPSFYSMLDVFVHAASLEPFGFVIIEAMLCGAPVVSTRTGVAADCIRHLENGYLAECKNSGQIAEGINYMLSHNTEKIRAAAKADVLLEYSFNKTWEKHIKLYAE